MVKSKAIYSIILRTFQLVILSLIKNAQKMVFQIPMIFTSTPSFGTEGTYYVTPDGYAISAFEEDAASYAAAPSGLRVETLLEKLKEMQK